MPTQDLEVSSVISSTGWTAATQANLSSDNDVRATDGESGEFIHCEIDDVPGDFSSMNTVTLHVTCRHQGTIERTQQQTVGLYNSSDTLLESFSTGDITASDVQYDSSAFSRSDSSTVINGWRLRVTCTEGGGMPGSETQEVDHMWVTLDYNTAPAGPAKAVFGHHQNTITR